MKISAYKAEARALLLGKYGTVFWAGVLRHIVKALAGLLLAGCIGIAIQNAADMLRGNGGNIFLLIGAVLVSTVLILFSVLLNLFFRFGYITLERNIVRGNQYSAFDIFSAFRRHSGSIGYVLVRILLSVFLMIPTLVFTLIQIVVILIAAVSKLPADSGAILMVRCGLQIFSSLFVLWLSLRFFFVEYVAVDQPGLGVMGCFRESFRLSRGKAFKILLFTISFIFWGFLSLCTLGFLNIWLSPYLGCSVFNFYLDARGELQTPGRPAEPWAEPPHEPAPQAGTAPEAGPAPEAGSETAPLPEAGAVSEAGPAPVPVYVPEPEAEPVPEPAGMPELHKPTFEEVLAEVLPHEEANAVTAEAEAAAEAVQETAAEAIAEAEPLMGEAREAAAEAPDAPADTKTEG